MIVNSRIENAKALFKELDGEFYPFGYVSAYNELVTESTDWLDYSQPVANTATGSFVYYIVPKTSRGSLVFSIGNGGGGNFECELDNIKVEQVNSTFQPLYTAVLNTMSDQYAFGAPQPGRNFNAPNYRYGFNGKENDRETVGTGAGTQDYGMRIYNPSLGKFLSVDPLTRSYPSWSPYPFAMNRPIDGVDLDGLEWAPNDYSNENWRFLKPELKIATAVYLADQVTQEVQTQGIQMDHKMYSGILDVPIVYGGSSEMLLGYTSPSGDISLHEGALVSPNYAASILLHEFNGHYMEQELDLIPNTKGRARIENGPNPFKGEADDPYNGAENIPTLIMLPSTSTLKEEVNAYGLQKELHDKDLLPIPDQIGNIEGNLQEHQEALDEAEIKAPNEK